MKKVIGIGIDGVIRDFAGQFDNIFRKKFIFDSAELTTEDVGNGQLKLGDTTEDARALAVKEKELNLLRMPVDTADFTNHYTFPDKKEEFLDEDGKKEIFSLSQEELLEKFIYEEYPYQIFAKAEPFAGAIEAFHKLQLNGIKSEEYDIVLLSKLKGASIPSTYTFFGNNHVRAKNFVAVDEEWQKWDHCDILIDSSPEAIQSCPEGKGVIKINREWNAWDFAERSFDSIEDILKALKKEELVF
jgi:hypothetical protein